MINPARQTLVLLALAGALSAVGCSSTQSAQSPVAEGGPEWVDRPQNAYDDDEGVTAIYAVGIADDVRNTSAQRTMAISRGRTELANTLEVLVQNMVEDYQSVNRDFYEGMDTASSLEMWSSVSRQVTDQSMSGSIHDDTWRDPVTKTLYVLMKLEFNSVISAYKDEMEATFRREETRDRIKVDRDAMMGRLDEQLETLRGSDADAVIRDFLGNLNG